MPKPQPQEPQFAFLSTTHTRSPTRPLSVVLKSHCHLHLPNLRRPVPVSPAPPTPKPRPSYKNNIHALTPRLSETQMTSPPNRGFQIQGPPSAHRMGFTRVLPQVPQAPAGRKRVASLPANGLGETKSCFPAPTPPPARSPKPAILPLHLLTRRAHLRLWPRAAPRRVAWGGAGPEQRWRGAARRQGEGAAGDSAWGARPRPRPSAAGGESPGCARALDPEPGTRRGGRKKRSAASLRPPRRRPILVALSNDHRLKQ